jgi:hypothetical protein
MAPWTESQDCTAFGWDVPVDDSNSLVGMDQSPSSPPINRVVVVVVVLVFFLAVVVVVVVLATCKDRSGLDETFQ